MNQGLLSRVLDLPLVSRVRRNHALEHATMQVLTETHSTARLMGRSSFWGFIIYGDVETEELLNAAREGLQRLKDGQRTMAIHPNCGSNYVVAGAIAGLGAFLAMGGFVQDKEEGFLDRLARLPLACAIGTLGVILSRPLGSAFQAYVTTEANVGDLYIVGATKSERAGAPVHFVQTKG